jgi:MscS family membrane protein
LLETLDNVYFGNTVLQYLIFLAYIFGGIVLGKIFYWLSTSVIKVFVKKTKTEFDDILIGLLEKPVIVLIVLGGIYLGLAQMNFPSNVAKIINDIWFVLLVLNLSWVGINFIDAIILNYIRPMAKKSKSTLDDHLVPLISKTIKVVLWVMVILMFIDKFGIDISTLLTGVGLGGLAFALAAQDLLSNLFGGIAILTDKPFKIGHRIKLDGPEAWVDGWVTEIGLRTTRIRTLDGTQLVIPNSDIAKSVLENVSREKARKVKLTVGLEYSTPQEKMLEAEKLLAQIVKKNKATDDESIVSFTEFAESSLNILLIYWIKDLDNILQTKNEINLAIKEAFEKAGISMAFPTRTVHMITETKPKKASKKK